MYCTDVLMREHRNIHSMTKVVKAMSLDAMVKGNPQPVDYRQVIRFVREYSDTFHHGKEEKILFARMMQDLGPVAEKMIRQGMLVEHDLGRFYILELEQAVERYEKQANDEDRLEIIVCAMEWAKLLQRHAEREDAAVYPLALRRFSPEVQQEIDEQTQAYEREVSDPDRISSLLDALDDLSNKYDTGTLAERS